MGGDSRPSPGNLVFVNASSNPSPRIAYFGISLVLDPAEEQKLLLKSLTQDDTLALSKICLDLAWTFMPESFPR